MTMKHWPPCSALAQSVSTTCFSSPAILPPVKLAVIRQGWRLRLNRKVEVEANPVNMLQLFIKRGILKNMVSQVTLGEMMKTLAEMVALVIQILV